MATQRMIPGAASPNPITVNGRVYTCAANSTLDVPDFDAAIMEANGWMPATRDGVVTTANRPAAPVKGQELVDSTLGKKIRWDGKLWRDVIAGTSI